MSVPTGVGIECHDLQSNPRFLFRQPRALQWFENGGLVKRSEDERQAGKENRGRTACNGVSMTHTDSL
jgi:hypothetical protein